MSNFPEKYCIDLHNYERFPVREVMIGDIGIGGQNPIRIQSMTNFPASDIENSVRQAKQIFDAGADFVRISTPRISDVEHLKEIKKRLHSDNYRNPLIADVHFNPKIAEEAAKVVEKVRINPGNYIDKRAKFVKEEYSDIEYKNELEKIHEKMIPLIKICKNYGTAVRVGSNHGSLSDRILTRYGNTIQGMVEAAMEYIDIFLAENFYNLVVSMKASDVRTMVKASRLLNARMLENSYIFPQHLGVTEAGEGEDGRIKSAVGIGSLLTDGIGDTIRVSLTEPPEKEIPFAKNIAERFLNKSFVFQVKSKTHNSFNPYENKANVKLLNENYSVVANHRDDIIDEADFIFVEKIIELSQNKNYIIPFDIYSSFKNFETVYPLIKLSEVSLSEVPVKKLSFFETTAFDLGNNKILDQLNADYSCIILNTISNPTGEIRYANNILFKKKLQIPIIVRYSTESIDLESIIAEIGIFPGSVLIDGLVSGVWLDTHNKKTNPVKLSLDLLQACGLRLSKAEFISCPSCGRTQFNIEKTTAQVKKSFSHLKGLKIAVMGCLVNGPGEMADADYGCVGSNAGHVHLYKKQEIIIKNVPEEDVINELAKLIKANGDWHENKNT